MSNSLQPIDYSQPDSSVQRILQARILESGAIFFSNTLEEINSRITKAEEQVDDLEDRMVEITATEQNIEKRMKRNEDSLRPLGQH